MPWYTSDKHEIASSLKSAADDCKEKLENQHAAIDAYVSVFQDGENVPSRITSANAMANFRLIVGDYRSKYNIIRSLSSAAHNRIADIRPGVDCVTVGGDYSQKRRAKMVSNVIRGLFRQTKVHKKMQKAFLHCAVRDVGIVHVFNKCGSPAVEVVNPREILFDPDAAEDEIPNTILRRKLVDRILLKTQFPKHKKAIDSMPPFVDMAEDLSEVKDNIEVIEGYRLASMEGEKDGRHAIVAGDLVLCDEEYSKGRYPYVFIVFEPNVSGSVFGAGVANLLMSLQCTINDLIATIEGDMKRSTPYMLVYGQSTVTEDEAESNERMRVIHVDGPPGMEPRIVFPQSVSPEMERKLKQYEDSAYDVIGISQPSSRGAVPAGINAGVAIRAHEDVQDGRFVVAKQNYQDAHVEVAELLLNVCQKIAEDDPEYEVEYRSKGSIDRVKWKEVFEDLSDFVLEVKPIGALSSSLPGRMQEAKDMMDLGFIETKEQAASLMDFPDLEQYRSFALAQHNAIEGIVDKLLDPDPEPIEPDEHLPVDILRSKASDLYAKSLVDEIPEENLQAIRDFIERCDQILEQQAQKQQESAAAMAAGQGMAGAPQQAMPAPMPTQAPVQPPAIP
jgi:hypothetical protein